MIQSYREMMKCRIPEGVSKNWRVERFTVSEEDASFGRMRAMYRDGRYTPAGTYTKLVNKRCGLMMSDAPDELRDCRVPWSLAKGTCLITGLGLGCITQGILEKRKEDGSYLVDKVTVIEKEEEVIELVGTHLKARYGDRLEIRHADALEYVPPKGERYDMVWHDIWIGICSDNLSEMTKLHRKYGRRCDWQGSWGKYICKRQKNHGY